jgi:hypothetical protein
MDEAKTSVFDPFITLSHKDTFASTATSDLRDGIPKEVFTQKGHSKKPAKVRSAERLCGNDVYHAK